MTTIHYKPFENSPHKCHPLSAVSTPRTQGIFKKPNLRLSEILLNSYLFAAGCFFLCNPIVMHWKWNQSLAVHATSVQFQTVTEHNSSVGRLNKAERTGGGGKKYGEGKISWCAPMWQRTAEDGRSCRSGEMSRELKELQLKTEAGLKDEIEGRSLTDQQEEKGTRMIRTSREGTRRWELGKRVQYQGELLVRLVLLVLCTFSGPLWRWQRLFFFIYLRSPWRPVCSSLHLSFSQISPATSWTHTDLTSPPATTRESPGSNATDQERNTLFNVFKWN